MKLPILLAVVVAFGLLRFVRANLLIWAGAWWIGIYLLLRFGFTAPIPSSVITIYMGIITLAMLAYVAYVRRPRASAYALVLVFLALGLAVAIPAVLAFNYLSTGIARDELTLTNAAGELIDRIERWGEPPSGV